MERIELEGMRSEYSKAPPLKESDLLENPLEQFAIWLKEAIASGEEEPNALILATATAKGKPSSRALLLKKFDERGFIFFTNYESKKAKELEQNPYASLTFLWKKMTRQVSVEGSVHNLTREESADYFSKRPRKSQLGAWASRQGKPIPSRETLEREMALLEKKYGNEAIPLPPFWGGFCLVPTYFDFWQGQPNRLHDRFSYTLHNKRWERTRLAP